MRMAPIAEGADEARRDGITIEDAAVRAVERAVRARSRLPGLGHRVHTTDPRVQVLFDLARQHGVAGYGVAFVCALERAASERIRKLPLNIDGALAAILHDLGFSPSPGRKTHLHRRTRRRPQRGSGGGIRAGEADAHPHSRRIPYGEPPRSVE